MYHGRIRPISLDYGKSRIALVVSILALIVIVAFVSVSAPVVANRISLLQDAVDETTAGAISLLGDVTGNTTLNVVTAIQGAPVDASSPVYGDIFTYNGASWTTQNQVNVTGNVTTASHLVTDRITSSTRTSPILVESNPRPQDTSILYLINTASLFSYNVVSGTLTVIGPLAAVLEDIAFCPDGTLYGKGSAGTLYEIDPLTANFTLIASGYPEQADTNTLACSPDGELYGMFYGYLYRYSRTNSSYETLGLTPQGNSNQGDLVFVGSTLYFGTNYGYLTVVNISDPSASYDLNPTAGSGYLTFGFGTTCTDDGVQMWGTNGASLYQIDPHSGDGRAPITLPSSTSNYNGMTSTCFAAPATALKMRGNLDLDMHDITHVSRMYVDNIYSSGTFTVPSARIHVHDTLNLHSTSRKGTNITFEDDGGTGYRSAIMWRTDTNLYRSTTSTIRTDNRFNVAQTADSKYEVSANGNVASTLGSVSGLSFVGNVPSINGLRTVVVGYDGGSGYVANNILTVTGCGGTGGTVTVTTVSSGVVTAITITRPGTGYVVGTNCATTGGAGTGATINITAVGSTTVTTAVAYQATPINAAGLYVTPAVTTAIGLQVAASNLGNGPVTVGTHIGVDIPATSAVATNAYGIRLAAPTGGTTINQAMNFVANTLPSGGITFGADSVLANWYRSAASTIKSDGDINVRHVITTAASIPTAAAGTGAGTGPTITVAAGSSDCRMMITVLTGTTPTASGNVFVLTYNIAFPSAVNAVVFAPRNAAAAALSGTSAPFVSSEATTTFTFTAGSAALTATTTYIWNFKAC
jgi:hypothetical protein